MQEHQTIPSNQKILRCSRIGYVPLSWDFHQPGDRRRFPFYAKERGLSFELADPSKKYDVVVLSQNADLSVWSAYNADGTKIVYDFIDSYLAIPKTSIKGWMRGPAKYFSGQSRHLCINYWKSIAAMCKRADAVICSTKEQEADISRFCLNIHIILDAQVELVREVKNDYTCHKPFRLVWEGLPQNLESLKMISPIIERLSHELSLEFHIITDPHYKHYLGRYWTVHSREIARKLFRNCVFHEWRRDTLANNICACDLAVIPIRLNDSFARGKPENKLLLFWRMGMPVLVSATPSYVSAMRGAGLDGAVYDSKDWLKKLSALVQDRQLRERSALLGKAYVDGFFSSSDTVTRWDKMFESLGFLVS
jgi:hypothetical protein